jgi:hypothetical protein
VKTGKAEICGKMAEYVKKRGKVIVINPEKDKTMVQVNSLNIYYKQCC